MRRAAIPLSQRNLGKGNSIAHELAAQMMAAYESGKSLSEVGRMFPYRGRARNYGSVREVLVRRGVTIRETPMSRRKYDPLTGRLLPKRECTDEEIRGIVAALPRMMVPLEIKHEYTRKWSLFRRRWLLGVLRERFPSTMPKTPPSHGMVFDALTPDARAVMKRMYVGTTSRTAVIKLDIRSEGILFEDTLWFWSPKVGYQSGPYSVSNPRRLLHWVLWERYHKKRVPDAHLVRHADRNVNNFAPENLVLEHRETVLRSNQLVALRRKSSAGLRALVSGGAALAVATTLKKTTNTKKGKRIWESV